MEENRGIPIYIIVATGADADRGFFPDPEVRGSFRFVDAARTELCQQIRAELLELDERYDKIEEGEDCWEAYQDGYAAALFSRIEILSSTLF